MTFSAISAPSYSPALKDYSSKFKVTSYSDQGEEKAGRNGCCAGAGAAAMMGNFYVLSFFFFTNVGSGLEERG